METLIIRGKSIGAFELACIRKTVQQNWEKGRVFISRKLCTDWDWRQYNGQLKDVYLYPLVPDFRRRLGGVQ